MEDAGVATGPQQLGGDRGQFGQGLLADDMLAGSRRGQDDLPVQHGRQAGDDQVDVIGQGRTPVLRHAPVPEAAGQLGRQRSVHVGHEGQLRSQRKTGIEGGDDRERSAVGAGHRARADHRDAHGRWFVDVHGAGSTSISSTRIRRPSRAEVRMASHTTAAR